jgi:multidrug resistance efflux pump
MKIKIIGIQKAYAGVGLLLACSLVGYFYWERWEKTHVGTDDAQVESDMIPIVAPQAGRILQLHVKDHQPVKKGDILLEIDGIPLKAPMEGTLSKLAIALGQTVQEEQLLVQLLPPMRFILANFKETQVGRMHPGQKAEIHIDAYPEALWEGRVESISPATGARFSLLPPDNATGNFVKVVQRVPVKIALLPLRRQGVEIPLRAGLSAEVTVKIE